MYHCAHCISFCTVYTIVHSCALLCASVPLCTLPVYNIVHTVHYIPLCSLFTVHTGALLCASVPLHLDPVRSPHHPYEPWILWKQTTSGNESFSNVDIYIHMWRVLHKNTRGFPSFHLGLLSCEFVDFNVWICGFVDLWISICGFPIFVLGCEAVMCTPAHCSSRFRGFSF